MTKPPLLYWTLAMAAVAPLACGGDSGDAEDPGGDPGDTVATISVSGTVVDFLSGDALDGATVSTDGLSPAPTVSVTGSDFTITGVAPFSSFNLLASSPPGYRSTYNAIIETGDEDVAGVTLMALSEDFIDQMHTEFGVQPADGTSLILAQLLDAEGNPVAGVPGDAFALTPSMTGPFFLDADRAPDANLGSSSASGYVVVFDIEPGLVSFTALADSGYAMTMADSPVAERAATLATIEVTSGEIEIPTGVSFSQDVAPIFETRGCVLCHDGGGVGKDLGGLHLNGAPDKMYKEVVEEVSANLGVSRVNLEKPADSILLTFPSREDPPDEHPNATFLSNTDPDYLIILGWITEGALNN
jgi:hypothetical protein